MFRTLITAAILTSVMGGCALAETFEVKMLNKNGKENILLRTGGGCMMIKVRQHNSS
ncbi:hypothetical protein SAMN04488056_12913 [Cohaesibacter marisflavi]|uniref:Uncharacterized protein n=1 Tax=Cohaesibacter marisflavi TaxID=655353 RepID=A0A1I5NE01_9HYPH|nr:hypothetical protein SAMN04488056_12913 [Cohaesibacter marisflavi]